jgi:hypothetical protein
MTEVFAKKVLISKGTRVVAPFDWEFVREMRALNAFWDKDHLAWFAHEEHNVRVRSACLRCYGTDGHIVDQVDAHVFTAPASVIEAPANERELCIAEFDLGRLVQYDVVLADSVEILSGELCRRKEKTSDHRIRFVAPKDREGHIVFHCAPRARAERLSQHFANGPVDGQLAVVTRTLIKPVSAAG